MSSSPPISVTRLRLGIFLFVLWWLPAYFLGPIIATALHDEHALFRITVTIMIAQTVLGLLGVLLAGKQVATLLKRIPHKQLPKTVWQLFWKGSLE